MNYDKLLRVYENRYPRISDVAVKAHKRMPHVAWEYLQSGTGDEELLEENRKTFQSLKFLPRFCMGKLHAEVTTSLFGIPYDAPIGIAPVGLTGLMWPKIEQHLAKTAKRLNIPYTLSTVATETPETIGELAGDMGWFQLYPPKDLKVRQSLLQRARDAGFTTLVVTADVPMASRRERSKKAGLAIPLKITPKLIWDGITHPAWSWQTLKHGLPRLRTVEDYSGTKDLNFTSGFVGNRLGGTLDWKYCEELKNTWKGPVVLKGILHPEDAKKAVDIGLDGVYVSNHGGRQFNGAVTAFEALPGIVEAIKGRVPVLFDSGIRTGLDAMKALHLGADFVFAGRPFVYGVSGLGPFGGDHVANILIDDLKNNMVQLGVSNLIELREVKSILSLQ